MQLSYLSAPDLAETLADAEVLALIDAPGNGTTYVFRYGGQDMIAVTDMLTGDAAVVHALDDADMGSVHLQAILGRGQH